MIKITEIRSNNIRCVHNDPVIGAKNLKGCITTELRKNIRKDKK